MLWAHVSHLFYDDAKDSTSVGEILHSLLDRSSTHWLPSPGGHIMLFNDTNDDIGYAFVRGNGGALKSDLLVHCKPACFVDMRDSSVQLEGRRV